MARGPVREHIGSLRAAAAQVTGLTSRMVVLFASCIALTAVVLMASLSLPNTVNADPPDWNALQAGVSRLQMADPANTISDATGDEYGGLSDAQAAALASREFGDEISTDPSPLPAWSTDQVVRYESAHSVLIDGGDHDGLISSTAPLLSRVGDGSRAPVDLTLEADGDSYSPQNPAVPQELGPNGELTFPAQGVSLKPVGADGGDPQLVEGAAFLASAYRSTDLVSTPTPTGADSQIILRSSDAPQEVSYRLDLAPTEEASLVHGGLVINRGGQNVATIPPPAAADANGAAMDASYSLNGNTLVVHVPHDDNAAYPEIVDPNYVVDYINDYDRWTHTQSSAYFNFPTMGFGPFGISTPTASQNAGTYHWYGGYGYGPSEAASWWYPSPPNTFIWAAGYSQLTNVTQAAGAQPQSCDVSGIINSAGNAWINQGGFVMDCSSWHSVDYGYCMSIVNGACQVTGPDGDVAAFFMSVAGWTNAYYNNLVYDQSNWVALSDGNNPTIDTAHISNSLGGWVDSASGAITAPATDSGLGVKSETLTVPQQGGTNSLVTQTSSCDGTHTNRCPSSWQASSNQTYSPAISYSTANMPEGVQNLSVKATDIVGRDSTPATTQVQVDHSPPDLLLSGELYESRGGTVGPGSLDLSTAAFDGLSGAKSIDVAVDSQPKDHYEVACPDGSCDLDHTWTFTGADYSSGTHTISVTATDIVGRQSPAQTFQVNVDKDAPETTITSGPPPTNPSGEATFAFGSSEGNSTFECKMDSGPWEQCTSPKAYQSLHDGSHTFSVRATDPYGNTDQSPATQTFVVANPTPDTWIDSGPSNPTPNTTPTFTFSGNQSGLSFECRMDNAGNDPWQPCTSPKTYPPLADGQHTFEVRSKNALQTDPTPASQTWTVDSGPPSITLGGEMNDSSSTAGTNLQVTATDGSADEDDTSPANLRSGVKSIQVNYYTNPDPTNPTNPTSEFSETLECGASGTSCPSSVDRDVDIPFSDANGNHLYEVTVTNGLNVSRTVRWSHTTTAANRQNMPPLGYHPGYPPRNLASASLDMTKAQQGGATWTSIPVPWQNIETDPNNFNYYDWSEKGNSQNASTVAGRARAVNPKLNVLLAISGTAPGTSSICSNCAPTNTTAWANFITAVLNNPNLNPAAANSSYAPVAIQIWNEPNNDTFSGSPSAYSGNPYSHGMPPSVYYSQIFVPAYNAIQNYNSAHPTAPVQILAPGTASFGTRHRMQRQPKPDKPGGPIPANNYKVWLADFVGAAAANHTTNFKVAQHLYPNPAETGPNQSAGTSYSAAKTQMATIYRDASGIANSSGLGPVWPTEMGLSTSSNNYPKSRAYDQSVQSDALVHTYCHIVANQAPAFIYRLVDDVDQPSVISPYNPDPTKRDPGKDLNPGFGVMRWTANKPWRPKPAYGALQDAHNGNCHGH